MAEKVINIFLTTFHGLGLPRTLSIPEFSSTPIRDVRSKLLSHLPALNIDFRVLTYSRKELSASAVDPISSLLLDTNHDFLSLWVSVPLRGGKGGFGSQLRAAGGRMASKKKRNQGENNGSSRNLDGRRLRTVTEAKALAEYLAVKPEMEQREKEARRQRWLGVVEMAEKREGEIRSGGRGKIDGQWVEDKEEAAERTREAVLAAMQKGTCSDVPSGLTRSSADISVAASEPLNGHENQQMQIDGTQASSANGRSSPIADSLTAVPATGIALQCFGFDEDDEFISDDGSLESEMEEEQAKTNNG